MKFRLNGIVPNHYIPSRESLTLRLDITGLFNGRARMQLWFEELEDLIREINMKYAAGSFMRRRGFQVQYKTDRSKIRYRILEITPVPSRVLSVLSTIRTEFYRALNENAIILYKSEHGHSKKIIYFIPEANVKKFYDKVDELNRKMDELNRMLSEYINSKEFQRLVSFLSKTVPPERWSQDPEYIRFQLGHIRVNPMPFPLSDEVIEKFVDHRLKEDLKKQAREMAGQVLQDVGRRIYEAMLFLSENYGRERAIERCKERLNAAKEMAKNTGLFEVFRDRFEHLERLLRMIEERKEKDALIQEMKEIARKFGVHVYSNDPLIMFHELVGGMGSVTAMEKEAFESLIG